MTFMAKTQRFRRLLHKCYIRKFVRKGGAHAVGRVVIGTPLALEVAFSDDFC